MTAPFELAAALARDRTMIAVKIDKNYGSAKQRRTDLVGSIIEREIETGSMFLVAMPERRPFVFVGLTQQIVPIPRARRGGDQFWSYMNRRYGIGEAEEHSRHILDGIRAYALNEGARVDVRRFAAFKTATRIAYFSTYDGQQWRVDGENVIPIPNGEDDVFFIDDDGGIPITPEIGPNGVLFERLIDSIAFAEVGMGGITAEQMKRSLIVWMFALAFPDLMPTKPLLILEGAPGSGKSAAIQLLQTALMGQLKPIILSKNKPDDFGVLLLRSPLCMLDNLDSYIDWLPDSVCGYATRGTFARRKLFTDDEELVLRPHAFIAVASKNPASFRREDTVDRLIIVRMERRDTVGLSFTPVAKLEAEILALRPQLLGEYLHYVNLMVAEIRKGVLDGAPDTKFRMGDFAAFANVVSNVLGWEEGAVDELLTAIQCEQASFHNEVDPTVDLINRWLTFRPNNKWNIGREIDLATLHRELESIAQASQIQFYKVQMLMQKLRAPSVEREFIIQSAIADGVRTYKIWRRTDPRLELVPMPDEGGEEGNGTDD